MFNLFFLLLIFHRAHTVGSQKLSVRSELIGFELPSRILKIEVTRLTGNCFWEWGFLEFDDIHMLVYHLHQVLLASFRLLA